MHFLIVSKDPDKAIFINISTVLFKSQLTAKSKAAENSQNGL